MKRLIEKTSDWIWIKPKSYEIRLLPPTPREYWDHWGKWLIFNRLPFLEELARKLEVHIEKREIENAKYSPHDKQGDPKGICVMCVYCDDRDRDGVFDILMKYGIARRIWKYDHETREQNGETYDDFIKKIRSVDDNSKQALGRMPENKTKRGEFFQRNLTQCTSLSHTAIRTPVNVFRMIDA